MNQNARPEPSTQQNAATVCECLTATLKRVGAEKKTSLECRFWCLRVRGRREISLTSLYVRMSKLTRLSVAAILALAAYWVTKWLVNR